MPKCREKIYLKIHALSQPLWPKKMVFPATFFILQPWQWITLYPNFVDDLG